MNNNISKLYHYTDQKAFVNIIEKKELWASSIFCMNDSNEAVYAIDLFEEIAKEMGVANEITKGRLSFEALKSFAILNVYVVSFSENEDDLYQWKNYANPPNGICIEFRKNEFEKFVRNNECIDNVEFVTCIYDKNEQRKHIENLIIDYKSNKIEAFKLEFDIIALAASFKERQWEREKEIRLVFKIKQIEGCDEIYKPETRFGKNGLTFYSKLPICPSLCIGDVILGAQRNNNLYAKISNFCIWNNFDFFKKCSNSRELRFSKSISSNSGLGE